MSDPRERTAVDRDRQPRNEMSTFAAGLAVAAADRVTTLVTNLSPPAAKIALFRSCFRGRDDVYPRRFESRKTGRAGYALACGNEWIPGVCAKPRIKCADCPNRRFLPVTDDVIRWHLSGQDPSGRECVIGVYPMLQDETTFLLAVDFDGEGWSQDALAFQETCRRLALPAALERSRSGHGGHVWFFFDEAVPAALARKLGSHVLTETMEQRPEIGLRSYDRLFPNQDTLPRGGFGNLIALPMQKRPRMQGHSLFLDEQLKPHADQWAFLSSVDRIGRAQLETIVLQAEHRGRVVGVRVVERVDCDDELPWDLPPSRRTKDPPIIGPLPDRLEIVLADQVYVAKQILPPALRNRVVRLAAFQNPEFHRAQAMRLPTYDKPRIIACAEDHPQQLALPRGCLDELLALLTSLRIEPILRDERCRGRPLPTETSFAGVLRPEQQTAAEALARHDTGVLAATTAFGKTVIAAWLVARRGVNTLILVHRRQLLEQWVERLSSFLSVPSKSIGRLGGGRKRLTGNIDVALMQSLVRRGTVDDRVADYGHLIVDECHHLSARSFELVARRAKAKYVTGLSATVARKDGHHPIIFMQCGPVRYRVDAKHQAAQRPFVHRVHVRPTSFMPEGPPDDDPRVAFQRLCDAVHHDETRNGMIAADVVAAVRAGRSPLVLTERTDHLHLLAARLAAAVAHVIKLQGGMRRRELEAARTRLAATPDTGGRVVLATGKYIGEGFDDPQLDTLFLVMPVSWRGTIAQYVGRLHRLRDGKQEVRVYDYADLNVPMLARMFDRRCRGYEALGYEILLPASALPGWPAEVPLPIDPEWKRNYAASVRRLLRDGVDIPLAQLFTHVARPFAADAEGDQRARSASEAFLFRRLQTLPDVANRFRLNAELPIPFGGRGHLEVDFLCAEARLVIELDGGQHLGDVEAYRRDRKKDALLQQHGFLVLRFLAEDLGRDLDGVLDSIVAALAHRRAAMRG